MGIRVAINGFGRIGRALFRIISQSHPDIEVVAVNDIGAIEPLVYLLKYDTIMGTFEKDVQMDGKKMIVDGKVTQFCQERSLEALPWANLEVDFAIESTGVFRKRGQIEKHLTAGAKKVLLTVPAKDPIDATIVMGVNEEELKGEHKLISNASCTTNCLAPLAKVLHENFGIKRGFMTTIHAYTNDQRLADVPHKDFRRARAASQNIIPTTTGAAKAVGQVLPALKGKLDGMAMRVPVPDGSIVDLVTEMAKDVTVEEVNQAIKIAAEGPMKGVLAYSEDHLVSSDIIGNPHSSVFDAPSTMVVQGNYLKTVSWYDNEWGYSNRVIDLLVKSHRMSG